MSKNRYILDTPAGKIRTVIADGIRYYMIKDVCVGIGMTGHSPWSWHAKETGNKERYYRRWDLERKCLITRDGGRNTATIITYDGMMNYLASTRIRNKPEVLMLRTWFESQIEDEDKKVMRPYVADILPLEQAVSHEAEQNESQHHPPVSPIHYKAPDPKAPALMHWLIDYICPGCGARTAVPTKYCPECGSRLEAK